jgi:hypothetical protein
LPNLPQNRDVMRNGTANVTGASHFVRRFFCL